MKRFLRVLAIFVVLLLVAALFLPKNFEFQRQKMVHGSPEDFYPLVKNFESWPQWEPWMSQDAQAVVSYTDSSRNWEGPRVGKGSLVIDSVQANAYISMNLTFFDPNPMEMVNYWTFSQQGDSTLITMGASGDFNYPFGRILGSMVDMEGMMGPDLEMALEGLAKAKAKP